MSRCKKDDEIDVDGSFVRFAKILLKSFIIITSVVCLTSLKKKFITPDSTLFNVALFIVICTPILATLGIIDKYIFDYVAIGIGMAIGIEIFNVKIYNQN